MGSIAEFEDLASEQPIPLLAPAAVLLGKYGDPYCVKMVPTAVPSPSEALVRLSYTGVCHGDIYTRDGGGPAPAQPVRPLIGGHEGVGTIVALGHETGSSLFRIGDVVGIAWRSYVCKTCDPCREGYENHCYNQKVTGAHRDGTFQRYVAFPVSQLIRIPPGIPLPSVCPILCAGVTSYAALKRMEPQPGKWCAIVGAAGGLGHLAIQYAKTMGLKVLAIDGGSPRKADFCFRMGADTFVDFTTPNLVEEVQAKTGGGPQYVLILNPHQSSYDAAGQYARFGAKIMAIGIGNACFPLRPILKKDLVILSSETGTSKDMRLALETCASGKVVPELEIIRLESINDALDQVKAGQVFGRLVVDFGRTEVVPSR